jgi:CubicO group peptidase (beta-lactamase class C family)
MGANPSRRLLNEPFPHEFWKTRKPERWLGYGITWATMGVNGIKAALMHTFGAMRRVGIFIVC